MKALIPIPICPTCGKPCRRRWRTKGVPAKYCSTGCVPRETRVEGGRRGRVKWALEHRLARFRVHLRRLQRLDKITGQDLVAVFMEIDRQAWKNGYSASEDKWLRRLGRHRRQKAAA